MGLYIIEGFTDPRKSSNWAAKIVLERDSDGNPVRVLSNSNPLKMNKEEVDRYSEKYGLVLKNVEQKKNQSVTGTKKKSSVGKITRSKAKPKQQAGGDVVAASPDLNVDQSDTRGGE